MDVDRTLDELIAEGKGSGRKASGGGGGKGKRGKGRGAGNKDAFWSEPSSTPWGDSPSGQAFWLHDDRAGGMPDPDDYKSVKGKSKGRDGGGYGKAGKGGGKNRAEPYETRKEGNSAGKWKHDLFMAVAEDEGYETRPRKKGGGKGKKGGKGGGAGNMKAGGSGYCPW